MSSDKQGGPHRNQVRAAGFHLERAVLQAAREGKRLVRHEARPHEREAAEVRGSLSEWVDLEATIGSIEAITNALSNTSGLQWLKACFPDDVACIRAMDVVKSICNCIVEYVIRLMFVSLPQSQFWGASDSGSLGT